MNGTKTILDTGIVPVFYHPDKDLARKVLKACYEGGIWAFEFTDRGPGALEVFKDLAAYARENCPGLVLGAGTILSAEAAESFIAAGAEFWYPPAWWKRCWKPLRATVSLTPRAAAQ